jgi:hypothetical protein
MPSPSPLSRPGQLVFAVRFWCGTIHQNTQGFDRALFILIDLKSIVDALVFFTGGISPRINFGRKILSLEIPAEFFRRAICPLRILLAMTISPGNAHQGPTVPLGATGHFEDSWSRFRHWAPPGATGRYWAPLGAPAKKKLQLK